MENEKLTVWGHSANYNAAKDCLPRMMKLMAPWEGQNVEMMIMGIEFYSCSTVVAGKVESS